MLLKSVSYHNFRPFIGDQKIEFTVPTDTSDKNVTVILGENTFGKSTIVLSFVWCLYGESRFNKPNDILNKKIEARMKPFEHETAWVEIEFEDGGKHYVMRRTQRFTADKYCYLKADQSTATLHYFTETGEKKPVADNSPLGIKHAVDEFIPHDLASFFFFEGEKNNEIEKKDLGDAVRTLLGLKAYGNMRKHLMGSDTATTPTPSSVMGYYLEKQKDVSDSKAQAEYNKMVTAQAALRKALEDIEQLKKDIAYYEGEITKINEALRKAAPFKELQKRRDAIKIELKQSEDELQRLYKKLFTAFSKNSLPLFIVPFISRTTQRLKEMDVADKGIPGLEAPAINALLNRGVCLCGTDLKPGTLAYKNVQKYINYVPPKSVGTIVAEMLEKLDVTEENAKGFLEDFEDLYVSIQQCRVRINKLEQEESEKLAEITKIGKFDTGDAEANLISYKKKLKELNESLERKRSEEGRRRSEIDTAERNFNMQKSKSDKAREYMQYYKYAEAVYNWVNVTYSQKEAEMRERLNKNVTELFNSMYAGKREIRIDEKYNINLTVNGSVVDITGGLRVIQYFAYVGGLVKLAYEVMREREKDEDGNESIMGEQYPLVLDAAFSHADQTHTRNIAQALAGSSTQLVFALMHKDWLHAQEGLVGQVGRMYELKKIDETEARIVEV